MAEEFSDRVTDVPRTRVSRVVGVMMAAPDNKWVSVEFDRREDGVDLFTVTAWVNDPT